jgi:hypothetical protein
LTGVVHPNARGAHDEAGGHGFPPGEEERWGVESVGVVAQRNAERPRESTRTIGASEFLHRLEGAQEHRRAMPVTTLRHRCRPYTRYTYAWPCGPNITSVRFVRPFAE